ncbi:hypothetical protein HELRODRAFT_148263, partial [Helobdella robusta]|uniref:BHLH domain-containing protein n=1 Tax=Helobdella robusta TaxID=6412 RepID=T1EK64_HELRO
VERRRRETLNRWIFQIAKILPDCPTDKKNFNKGAILSKTFDYITKLQAENRELKKCLRECNESQ